MGLDQYLYATKYVGGADWNGADEKQTYSKIVKAMNISHLSDSDQPSVEVTVKVGQWRKANQIHNWFVKNVQNGEDDCRKYYVSKDQLQRLLDTCITVLNERKAETSEELLPTASGFFFGNTDFDEWYYTDVSYTRITIEKLLNDSEIMNEKGWGWDFHYQSSW